MKTLNLLRWGTKICISKEKITPVWTANEKDPSAAPNDYASWINALQERIPVCVMVASFILFLQILCGVVNRLWNQCREANDLSQDTALELWSRKRSIKTKCCCCWTDVGKLLPSNTNANPEGPWISPGWPWIQIEPVFFGYFCSTKGKCWEIGSTVSSA